MFYKNALKTKNVKYKLVNYATFSGGMSLDYDENLTPVKYSRMTYNFSYKNGALTTGLGLNFFTVSRNSTLYYIMKYINLSNVLRPKGLWVYYDEPQGQIPDYHKIIVYDDWTKYLYSNLMYNSISGMAPITTCTFPTCPKILNYTLNGVNCLLIISKELGMYVFDGTNPMYLVSGAPIIKDMCMHNERLFALDESDKSALWFSDDLDPTNWNISSTEAGYIKFNDERGYLNKVVSFNDYLYVFRDYGITRVTAYAKQEDFKVDHMTTNCGKIFGETVCVCGNKIMFLAVDGIYVFNGETTTKLNISVNKLISEELQKYSNAVYMDGFYYLTCRMAYGDKKLYHNENLGFNNTILKIDCTTFEMDISRGFSVTKLAPIKDSTSAFVYAIVNTQGGYSTIGRIDYNGRDNDSQTEKYWKSPTTDFGYPYVDKLVKEIYLNTSTKITITVNVDGVAHSFIVKGSTKQSVIKINLRGRLFSIDFLCKEGTCNISNPQVLVGIL